MVTSIFSFFPHSFLPYEKNAAFWAALELSSANSFNLDKSTILSFGEEVKKIAN